MPDDQGARTLLIAARREVIEEQPSLFTSDDAPFDWQLAWRGMPEFDMGTKEPIQRITVAFACHEDVEEFARLIGVEHKITQKTFSIWFPDRDRDSYMAPKNFAYVDES